MSRADDLLRAAAQAFENAEDPFSTSWLVDHQVTADECFTLSSQIAAAIQLWRRSSLRTKADSIIADVIAEERVR